jgi:hypothetical protein
MVGQELVDLQKENIRLKALLLASQNEVYRGIEEKARLWQPHRDESRKLHEQDLCLAISELKEELEITERTDEALIGELEERVRIGGVAAST